MIPFAPLLLVFGAGAGLGWIMRAMHSGDEPQWLGPHAKDKKENDDKDETLKRVE